MSTLCSTVALAIGLYTTHIPAWDGYNENNKLVGVQCNHIAVATFENSYYNRSFMIGYDYELWRRNSLAFGVQPSVVTGYEPEQLPVPIPFVPVVYGQLGVLRLNLMGNAIHLNIQLDF